MSKGDNHNMEAMPYVTGYHVIPADTVSMPECGRPGLDALLSTYPAEALIRELLRRVGEDPSREGLVDTPARVVRAWREMTGGYRADPEEILSRLFESKSSEMVVCRDIEFYSVCEHHMLPFKGRAHVAYIPTGKVVGLSKLARVVEAFGKRLQIQEEMTRQIADALYLHRELRPKGCAVIIEAEHLCMKSRGVRNHSSRMVTSALRGCFEEHAVRSELLTLLQMKP